MASFAAGRSRAWERYMARAIDSPSSSDEYEHLHYYGHKLLIAATFAANSL